MSIDYEQLRDCIWQWADDNTPIGVPVIWDKPNVPRPCTPYVTLFISTILVKFGQDSVECVDSTTINHGGQRSLTVSVIAYGNEAPQIIMDLQVSLEKYSVCEYLRGEGLAIFNEPTVSDISALLETGFEVRSNMDIVFGVANNLEETITTIGEAQIEGEITNGSTKTVNITVNEP